MKLDDYEIKDVPQELRDFVDQVTTILNFGKYSNIVIDGSPGWEGREGESVFSVDAASGARLWYVYVNSGWESIGITPSTVKFYINFSGTGSLVINSSFNVSSLTRNSAGNFTITIDTDFKHNFYYVGGMATGTYWKFAGTTTDQTVGSVTLVTGDGSDPNLACIFGGGEI